MVQFQWIQGRTAPSKALTISYPATKIGEEMGCNETRAHDGEANAREKRNRSLV